jgi:hypothetical protein
MSSSPRLPLAVVSILVRLVRLARVRLGAALGVGATAGVTIGVTVGLTVGVLAQLVVQAGCAGGPLGEPVAAQQVTSELCAHAARCDDIGSGGRSYPSLGSCLGREAALVQTEWGAPGACPGIETGALDDCLAAIRSTSCGGETGIGDLWLGTCSSKRICRAATLP